MIKDCNTCINWAKTAGNCSGDWISDTECNDWEGNGNILPEKENRND